MTTLASARPTVVRPKVEGYFPKLKPGQRPNPTLGPVAVRWIESNMTLGEGDFYGKPMRLLPWMRRFIYFLLELVEEELPDGTPWMRFKYKRALLGMPKGSGKGPLIASLAAFFAFGPSQFDGWDDEGKPKGKIRTSALCQVSAASYKQAGLLFNDVADGVRNSINLGPHVNVYKGEVTLNGRPGKIERVHSTINAAEGSRPTVVIKDELHEWQGEAKANISQVLDNGLAKRRDTMSIGVSTAGPRGGDFDNAVLAKLYQHGVAVYNGLEEDDEFLFFWAECLTAYDLEDPIERRKAVLAASPSAFEPFFNVDAIVAEYNTTTSKASWERYRLNRWVEADEVWLPRGAWKACADLEAEPLAEGERCVIALDGSWNNDATSLVARSLERPYVELLDEWRPPAGYKGYYNVPIGEVEQHIVDYCGKFEVREVVCDPARFGRTIDVLSVQYGLPMVVYPQSPQRMVPATARAYEAILNGTLTHNGDPRLAAAVGNAVPKISVNGVQLTKPHSGSKIDSAVAMIMAWERGDIIEETNSVGYYDMDELLADQDDPRVEGW